MNTRIDRIKSIVIISLDFFEVINRFKEQEEAGQPAYKKDQCQHGFCLLMK
jgi:hypothetical protein